MREGWSRCGQGAAPPWRFKACGLGLGHVGRLARLSSPSRSAGAHRVERLSTRPEGKGVGPEGRWRAYDYDELMKRDEANLDIFWLKDKSLADEDDLPEPDALAQEIAATCRPRSTSSGRLRRS